MDHLRLVSIHAPVKGATSIGGLIGVHLVVSIHAPVKGATALFVDKKPFRGVSIHAPVKGATSPVCVKPSI